MAAIGAVAVVAVVAVVGGVEVESGTGFGFEFEMVIKASRVILIGDGEWSKARNKTYEGVALRLGFGSTSRMILVLRFTWFTDASSSSADSRPLTLRFLGRNGGGVRGRDML